MSQVIGAPPAVERFEKALIGQGLNGARLRFGLMVEQQFVGKLLIVIRLLALFRPARQRAQ